MTQDHKPHITLPNGDRIYQGGYGRTRDGRKVGPMVLEGGLDWKVEGTGGPLWGLDGRRWSYDLSGDLIAEWTDEPEAAPIDNASPLRRHEPDYNDGKWHGWNGGECPVHLKTRADLIAQNGSMWKDAIVGEIYGWNADHCNPIVAFRVVKPYTAPREWWIVGDCEAYASEAEALEACKALYGNPAPVHVREVTE